MISALKFLLIVLISTVNSQESTPLDIITNLGYKGQSYIVETADGYLLTIFRIFPKNISNVKKTPCFLMHGIMQSSFEYLQLKADSLPFILSNDGHEVFLGNSRGTQFSSHVKFSLDSNEFWNYSWHEMGIYDLSAIIDSVLNITKSEKLFFTGLSQGVTAVMVLLSMRPEYNQKILQLHLMGPVVFIGNPPNSFALKIGLLLVDNFQKNGKADISELVKNAKPLIDHNCVKHNVVGTALCLLAEYSIAGLNVGNQQPKLEALKDFSKYSTPYGSVKQFLHYKQIIETNRFEMYDYGAENLKIYGRSTPPEYDLKKVVTPAYIYYGEYDGFLTMKVCIMFQM